MKCRPKSAGACVDKAYKISKEKGLGFADARCHLRTLRHAPKGAILNLKTGLLYTTAMNWDWDKLQEKRQRQNPPENGGGRTPPPGQKPPDLTLLKEPFKRFKEYRSGKWLRIGVIALLVLWLLSGFYIVEPSQKGVVLRFGQYSYTVDSGPHYHLPYPIETVYRPNVTEVRIVEVGFRSGSRGRRASPMETSVMSEAVMLTGDENIVYLDFAVKYRIKDPVQFLFRSADPDRVVSGAAEAVMREVIGNTDIDPILTTGKENIQFEARRMLQDILDRYQVGIVVDALELQDVHPPQEVSAAFKDVIDASEDQRRFVNTATAYRNDILPKAVGSAEEMINQARAYRESRILDAQGETARFLALHKEYALAEGVTRQRMYLEAMEDILTSPGMEKLVLPDESASRLLPFLPLTGRTAAPVQGETR